MIPALDIAEIIDKSYDDRSRYDANQAHPEFFPCLIHTFHLLYSFCGLVWMVSGKIYMARLSYSFSEIF